MSYDHPGLYWAAMQACHSVGIDWTDPRTGIKHKAPKARKAALKRKTKASKKR